MSNPEKLRTGDGQEFEPVTGVTDTGYDYSVTIDGYEVGLSSISFQKLEGSSETFPLEDE